MPVDVTTGDIIGSLGVLREVTHGHLSATATDLCMSTSFQEGTVLGGGTEACFRASGLPDH